MPAGRFRNDPDVLLCGLWGGLNRGLGAELAGALFDGAHDAEKVPAVDFLDVLGAVALFEEGASEGRELVVRGEVGGDAGDAVEVSADAHVVDAGDLYGVVDLGDDVGEGGRCDFGGKFGVEFVECGLALGGVGNLADFGATVPGCELKRFDFVVVALGEVLAVKVDLGGATVFGERAKHVVGEVASVVGDGAAG